MVPKDIKTPKASFDFESLTGHINELVKPIIEDKQALEENIFLHVARKLLGREPNLSDAKRFLKLYSKTNPLDYDLLFDGIPVGRMTTGLNEAHSVTFNPHKDFK